MSFYNFYVLAGRIVSVVFISVLSVVRTKNSRQRVRGAIVSPDKKVLLIKDWFGNQKWNFPGGGIKYGESPEEALCREVYEELGIKIQPAECVFLDRIKADGLESSYYLIYVQNKITPRVSRMEILATCWVRPCEMLNGDFNALVNKVLGALN